MDFDAELEHFRNLLQDKYKNVYNLFAVESSAPSIDSVAVSHICGELAAIQILSSQLDLVLDEWGFIDDNQWSQVVDAYDDDEYSLTEWSKENAALPKVSGAFQAMIRNLKEDMEFKLETAAIVMQAAEFSKQDFEDIQIGPLREGMQSSIDWLDELQVLIYSGSDSAKESDSIQRIVYNALQL